MEYATIPTLRLDSLSALKCVDALMARVHAIPSGAKALNLDFTNINFVTPAGVVALALMFRMIPPDVERIFFTNIRSDIASYLERVDVREASGGRLVLPPLENIFLRSAESTTVITLQPIPSVMGLHKPARESVQDQLMNILNTWYLGEKAIDLASVISELLQNITHSQDFGYVSVQKYWNRQMNMNEVCIAVGDLGLGIHSTLLAAGQIPPETSQSAAISKALELNVSCRGGGLGLEVVNDYIKKWNGVLSMRSATGRVTIDNGIARTEDRLLYVPGVQVGITVRA